MHAGGRVAEDRLADLHFTMQDLPTAELARVEVGCLDASLRGLLFTDGTVTRALEAQTLRRVAVEVVDQSPALLSASLAAYLEGDPGDSCLRRRVTMSTERDGAPVAWAESHILPERLPARFMGLLDNAPNGIGGSIEAARLESRRELLWFRLGSPPSWADSVAPNSALIRLYRIITNERPALLIREAFAAKRQSGVYCPLGWTDRAPASSVSV